MVNILGPTILWYSLQADSQCLLRRPSLSSYPSWLPQPIATLSDVTSHRILHEFRSQCEKVTGKQRSKHPQGGAPACCGWRAGYTNWTSTEVNSDEVGDVIEGKLHCWKVQTWESQTPHHLQPHSNHGVPGIDKEVRETWSLYEGVVYISLYLY